MSESENPAIDAPEPKPDRPRTNQDWWPNQLDLSVLHQHSPSGQPARRRTSTTPRRSSSLDVDALKADIVDVMTDSQDWWPADYGHYGPLFIRLTWHQAGTYRIEDGRGGGGDGGQRFAPLNSWPDNGNLDKARRPALAGQAEVRPEGLLGRPARARRQRRPRVDGLRDLRLRLRPRGHLGARGGLLGPGGHVARRRALQRRVAARLRRHPFGAVTMGLIYVNPEGPKGNADPASAAHDIRLTFARMAMDDEETVALIAGGHTFGKAHGAGDPDLVGPEPEGCPVHGMGLGWKNSFGTRQGHGHDHQRPRGRLDADADAVGQQLLRHAVRLRVGARPTARRAPSSGSPKDGAGADTVPDAHDPGMRHEPMMATTDLALLSDPEYRKISERFRDNPDEFADAFARAWYKLLHRDMGPVAALPRPVGAGSRSCGRTRSPPSRAS